MVEAKQNLQKARGTVLTGYDGNEDLFQTAEEIVELSRSVLADMAQMRSKPKK